MRILLILYNYIVDKICLAFFSIFNMIHLGFKGHILMYHNFIIDGLEDTCTCSIERFNNHVKEIQKKNIDFISIDKMLDIIKSNEKTSEFVVVSFDDAYESVYTLAYPLLKLSKIPFVIYQSVGLLDKDKYLKSWQIDEMLKSGLCTLASHGMTHKMLSKMSRQDIECEMKKSKEILEDRFGVSVKHFAYPYGKLYSVGFTAPKIASKYYDSAVVTIPTRLNYLSKINNYLLSRVVLDFNYSKI